MVTKQLESPFFLSEEEAIKVIELNMEDLLSRIDALSTVAMESRTGATNVQDQDCLLPGGPPCIQCNGEPGPDQNNPFIYSCQCCQC